MAVEMANFKGLSHAGAPVMIRASTKRPTTEAPATTIISAPTAASGGLALHRRSNRATTRAVNVDRMVRGVISMTYSFNP
jgi:hypothetical protein